jgi:uncharacterized protein (TIGR03435 family)
MKIAILAALAACSSFAQDIAGTWQGTLQTPQRDLRLVVKISKEQQGLKAVLYSIDQGGPGIAGSVTVQGPVVKIAVPGIGGAYDAKLDSDAANMEGTWTQGDGVPLTLKRVNAEAAWPIPEPVRPKRMAADAKAVFEVATIKPSGPEAQGHGFRVNGRDFSTVNTSLRDLITFAYGLHPKQITGGPAWIESERYDVNAKPEGEGQPADAQWKAMVQKLLADRFQLKFHHEKKELQVYAIAVAKTGPKLTTSEGDPDGLPALFFRRLGALTVRNANMGDFAQLLQGAVLDRPVVDQTGLSGRFDFILNWTPDEFQFGGLGVKPPPPTDSPDAPPDLYTAIQQQVGLKIESTKALVDILVIDRVEKPSAN